MTGRDAVAAARKGWLDLAPNTRGALWILLSSLLFSIMAVLVKLIGSRLDSFQIAFFRAGFGFLAILPFAVAAGPAVLRTRHPLGHFMRGAIGMVAMFCGFYSIAHLPLADATAYSFTKPLFLILLAVLFLGEKVRARRITATAMGFLGVVIMMRPTGEIDHAAVVALVGAACVAVVVVLIKQLTRTEKPVSVLFWFGLISTTVALLPALVVWRRPTPEELFVLMAIGALGAAAQSCMIRGFAAGDTMAVSPFDYSRLIFAGVLGYLFFAELPDAWSLSGAAVIVGSTLYIAYREAKLARMLRTASDGAKKPPDDQALPGAAVPGAASAVVLRPRPEDRAAE